MAGQRLRDKSGTIPYRVAFQEVIAGCSESRPFGYCGGGFHERIKPTFATVSAGLLPILW